MDEFDRKLSKELKHRAEGVAMTDQEKDRIHRNISNPKSNKRKRGFVTWIVATAAVALFLILALPLLQQSERETAAPPENKYENMENLQLNVLQEKALPNGETEYLIEIDNGSDTIIHAPTLYFSFSVLTENGMAGNPFKYSEYLGLEIKPDQKLKVPITLDVDLLNQDTIDTNQVMLELKGYMNEFKPENLFHTGQSVSNEKEEGDRQWKKLSLIHI